MGTAKKLKLSIAASQALDAAKKKRSLSGRIAALFKGSKHADRQKR